MKREERFTKSLVNCVGYILIVVIAFVSLGYLYVWHTKKNFGVESGLNYLLFIGCFVIVYFITGKYRKHLEKKYENEFSQDDKSDKE